MRIKLTRLAVVVAASVGASSAAFALDPQSIRVSDGVMFTPTLKLQHGHNNNLYGTKNDAKSTRFTVVEPSFTLSLDRAKSAYQLKYVMSSKNYHSANDNSHIDHHLTAKSGFEFNARNRLMLEAGYHKLQSTTSDSSKNTGKNDKWNTKNIGGVYTFGAREARTQVDFGLKYDELRYDNSRKDGNGVRLNKGSERDATAGVITGYYAVAPKTKLLLEGRYTDYDYTSNDNRDSKNKALLAGVTWEATAKTTGTVKIGREKKDYKKSAYSDKSTGMWEAGITWAPRTYSTFSLNTRRAFDEGNTYTVADGGIYDGEHISSSIKTASHTLGWNHAWMDRLSSNVSFNYTDRDYQGDQAGREDTLKRYSLGLTYEVRRWLDIGVGYTYADNDSNRNNHDYKRNVYSVTFNASL